MLETSKDLLYVVLAFCLLWLTVFVSWLLYYVIAIARDMSSLVGQTRNVVDRIDSLTKAIHEKIDSGAASISLVAQAAKEVVTWLIRERTQKSAAPKRKKKEE